MRAYAHIVLATATPNATAAARMNDPMAIQTTRTRRRSRRRPWAR